MRAQFLTNAGNLATRQRLRGRAVDAALKAEARAWGQAVRAQAERLSQGTLTAANLRQMDGPYSVRFSPGAAGQSDAIINRRTGDFAAGWRVGVWAYRDGVTVTIWNASRESTFMAGTRLMRLRPVLVEARGAVHSLSAGALRAKRRAEATGGGFSLGLELINTAAAVGGAYGGALMAG